MPERHERLNAPLAERGNDLAVVFYLVLVKFSLLRLYPRPFD